MCGVFGAFRTDGGYLTTFEIDAAIELLHQSRIRGMHAFGLSGRSFSDNWKHFKGHNISDLKDAPSFDGEVWELLGHTRYSTSGEYKNPMNNQPTVLTDLRGRKVETKNLVHAFNGVIHMGLPSEYIKEYGIQVETENDGEIVMQQYLDGHSVTRFIFNGKFSYAGVLMSDNDTWIMRNANRPLWFSCEGPTVFLGSTHDIFMRAGFKRARIVEDGVLHTPKSLLEAW